MSIQYIVYNNSGEILRTGYCPNNMLLLQAYRNESVIEGKADDLTQKIVNNKVVDKTQAQIDAEKSPEVPFADKQAYITNGQLNEILDRLTTLEG